MANINWTSVADSGFDAFGNFQSGWEVGTPSENAYETFTNILNFAGQIAPTLGPTGSAFSIGLNQAAAANNTVSAIEKYNNGTLQASDILQITGSILSGLAAASIILGGSVPIGIAVTIAAIGLAGGPFAKNAINEAINALNNRVSGIDHGALGGMSTFSASAAEAATVAPRIDPLVLDLDGDGIETTSTRNGSIILFDHDGDGIKTGTGWVKPDDGWLVLDRNGNGTIDSGHELFGVNTIKSDGQLAKDGFDALKDLDANQDNTIDSIDDVFANLRIWRDLNQDGISQGNELSTLSDNSITAININSTAVRNDLGNGNIQTAAGSFTRSNGTTGITGETSESTAGNLDLLVSTFYRQFTTHIPLSDLAMSLPSLRGSGQVRDLNEAISLSSDLGETVASYTQQTTRQDQINQLDRFIDLWANTSEMKSLKEQANALANSGVSLTYQLAGLTAGSQAYEDFIHKLGVVERFMGFTYAGTNGQPRFTFLNANSGKLTVSLAGPQIDNVSLAYERLKTDIYESLLIETRLNSYNGCADINFVNDNWVSDFSTVELAFKNKIQNNARDGIIDLVEFISALSPHILNEMGWNATDFLLSQLKTAPDLGTFSEELSNGIIRFANANEHNLYGSSRADLIIGSDGADTITTGDGNDIILGGKGNDYINAGNGNDQILGGEGNDYINAGSGNDQILGGEGNDTIFGEEGNDFIDGGDGNDSIYDYYGFNTIKGGDGNDTITSRGIIEGGKGDDVITASDTWSGDTYIFNLGDGKDTISEYGVSNALGYAGNAINDTLKFGEGIDASAVSLTRSGNSLIFKISETDQVTIKEWFSNGFYQIETIEFADGSSWDLDALRNMAIPFEGTANNDVLYGWNGKNIINGAAGNDTIYGGGNVDILDGGEGDDYLNGGMGDDTYQFGLGSGLDRISDYDDQSGNHDVLAIGAGVAADQIWLRRVDNDLEVSIVGTGDKTTISNWYYGSSYHIEEFKTSNGKTLLDSQVDALVSAMAAFAPPKAGETTLPAEYQNSLNAVIAANWK